MRGFSLIEVMIALAVFSLVLSALSSLYFSNQFLSGNAWARLAALNRAILELQEDQYVLGQNFYVSLATSSIDNSYVKEVSTEDEDNFTKKIKVKMSWGESHPKSTLELHAYVTNWKEAFGQSPCQSAGLADWQSPQISGTIDLGYGNEANALFSRGHFIYLAVDNSDPRNALADKNDFFIVDVTDKNNPFIISKLDTGPGLSSLAVAGNYAYLGNRSINAQLQVVDISDKFHPRIVATLKLPGSYADATTIPNTIFFHRNKIYLGTAKSQIEEFHIINVENPLAPQEIGKWEANVGINNIYVNNHNAYLATPLNQELTVLDIADAAHPLKISEYDAPGGSGNGKSLSRNKNTLFLGRTVGHDEIFALDISDPAHVISLGSKVIFDSVNSMLSSGKNLFIGTNSKFQILNVQNLANMISVSTINLPAKVTGLSCNGQNIYLSLFARDGLRIVSPAL